MSKIEPKKSPCYCINFRRAANTITKFYDLAFSSIGLTANQFFLLISISQLNSCNKSNLAHYTRLDRTTIIRNLDTLMKKNLIEEAPGETKRNHVIHLTEKGETAITEGKIIWTNLQSKTKKIFGEENISILKSIFDDIEKLNSQLD